MSVPPDRVEEITRVVLRVIDESRPQAPQAGPMTRFWGWLKEHPTLPLAMLGFLIVILIARVFFGVGFWAIASELASDYREEQQRQDLLDEHLELGDRFLGAELLPAARTEFKQALQLEPTSVDARRGLLRATVFEPIAKRDYDPAIAEMRVDFLLDLDEDDADAHAFLGDINMQQGQYGEAIAHYTTARSKDESLPHAYSGLGYVYGLQDRSTDAADMYRRALELAPTAKLYRNNLAYELFRVGRYDAAIREYVRVLSEDPSLMLPYSEIAAVFRAKGDPYSARYYQEFLVRLFQDKQVLAAERNTFAWAFRTRLPRRAGSKRQGANAVDPRLVYLVTYPEKRAYMLLSFAFTAYLADDPPTAQRATRQARAIRLSPAQAQMVRAIVDFDVALVAREAGYFARDARRFVRFLLRDFGS